MSGTRTPERNHHDKVKCLYGVDYDELVAKQDGKCAVCGTGPGKFRLAVDHCHATGKVRGLLCVTCNLAAGYLRDNPELVRRLADYLEKG